MKKPLADYIGKDGIVGRPLKVNRHVLTIKGDGASVFFLGDVHYGSPQFDEQRFLGYLAYCLRSKTYLLLMGDLLESATRHSVGSGVYDQNKIVGEQHEQMVEWLRPIADAKLILGTHQGNHSERVFKETGFNIDKALARELDVPYLGDACWSEFRVGKETYSIYSLHGRTGSRFDGTALLAIERISTSFFADLVAMAHVHKCINSTVIIQKICKGLVKEHKKFLLVTGAFLGYGGYAAALGLPISKKGAPLVHFYSTKHDILITW